MRVERVVTGVFLRRTIALVLVLEAALLLVLAWFFLGLEGDVFIVHPARQTNLLPITALLGYTTMLLPVIVYAWRGALPAAVLPRYLVLAASLAVTGTQLVLPFAVEGGLDDSLILWGFSIALGLAYMLNYHLLRPAPATKL